MDYKIICEDDNFSLSSSNNLKKAKIGLYHLGFIKNDLSKVISIDDKKSIESAISFYNILIKKGYKKYPISTIKSHKEVNIENKKVIQEIIGLPFSFYEDIDFNKDIISQLTFEDNLTDIKKYTYRNIYNFLNKKWYSDIFKNYCLEKGVFFLYDETIPFINDVNNIYPVLIDEKKISKKISNLLSEATSLKLIIECLDQNIDENDILEFEKYDIFSFTNRVDYFINNLYVKEIADLNPSDEFKRIYSRCLRIYFAFIINYLYDKFLNEITKNISFKKSVFTESKISNYYVISNLNSEMYSLNKVDYYFPINNREILTILYNKYKNIKNTILLYKAMKLPWAGYEQFLTAYNKNRENPFDEIEYIEDISFTDNFLSTKRVDQFYNYDSTLKDFFHNEVYINRELIKEGLLYKNLVSNNFDDKIQLEIVKGINNSFYEKYYDNRNINFSNYYLDCYIDASGIVDYDFFFKLLLEKVDSKSDNKALNYFINNIDGKTIAEIKKDIKKKYNLNLNHELIDDFLIFVLNYPKYIMQNKVSKKLFSEGNNFAYDCFTIPYSNIDTSSETYEVSLPLKFVSYGQYFYSFKKEYTSKSYICSCQKEAVHNLVEHFSQLYHEINPKYMNLTEFLLSVISLPKDIKNSIDSNKDFLSQLKFKEHICHLCNNSEPLYSNITIDDFDVYNDSSIYETYINAIGAKNNIYIYDEKTKEILLDKIEEKNQDTKELYISQLLSYDFKKEIPTILKPFFDIDGAQLTLLICSTILCDFNNEHNLQDLVTLFNLSKQEVKKALNNKSKTIDFDSLYVQENLSSKIFFTYNIIIAAYRNILSKQQINLYDDFLCLNDDYNNNLPYPYIFLGKTFNAYSSSVDGKEIYLCSCDKKGVELIIKKINRMFKNEPVEKRKLKTLAVLSLSGLPYHYIKNYIHYEEPLTALENFKYKDNICRRCLNENHAAYHAAFIKVNPNKDEMTAEYSFAKSKLANGGLTFIEDVDLSGVHFDPDYKYDINQYENYLIPAVLLQNVGDNVEPDILYKFTVVTKQHFETYLSDYCLLSKYNKKTLAAFTTIMKLRYDQDSDFFYDFIRNFSFKSETFSKIISLFFEEIIVTNNIDINYYDFCQLVLGFVTYILEKLFEKYANDERKIGR